MQVAGATDNCSIEIAPPRKRETVLLSDGVLGPRWVRATCHRIVLCGQPFRFRISTAVERNMKPKASISSNRTWARYRSCATV